MHKKKKKKKKTHLHRVGLWAKSPQRCAIALIQNVEISGGGWKGISESFAVITVNNIAPSKTKHYTKGS